MYSGKKVKELLEQSPYSASDLAEKLYEDRARSLANIISDTANPTAKVLEKVACFLHVSVDSFFVREDGMENTDSEYLTQQVWRTQMDAKDVENAALKSRIETLEKLVASMEREEALLREKAEILSAKNEKKSARK